MAKLQDEMQNNSGEFGKELESLINRSSQENESDTPDFILAGFLRDSLSAWNRATKERERWFGRRCGNGASILAKTPERRMMVGPGNPGQQEPHEECPDCRGEGCVPFTNKNPVEVSENKR
jgi:hypothetical protein